MNKELPQPGDIWKTYEHIVLLMNLQSEYIQYTVGIIQTWSCIFLKGSSVDTGRHIGIVHKDIGKYFHRLSLKEFEKYLV